MDDEEAAVGEEKVASTILLMMKEMMMLMMMMTTTTTVTKIIKQEEDYVPYPIIGTVLMPHSWICNSYNSSSHERRGRCTGIIIIHMGPSDDTLFIASNIQY